MLMLALRDHEPSLSRPVGWRVSEAARKVTSCVMAREAGENPARSRHCELATARWLVSQTLSRHDAHPL